MCRHPEMRGCPTKLSLSTAFWVSQFREGHAHYVLANTSICIYIYTQHSHVLTRTHIVWLTDLTQYPGPISFCHIVILLLSLPMKVLSFVASLHIPNRYSTVGVYILDRPNCMPIRSTESSQTWSCPVLMSQTCNAHSSTVTDFIWGTRTEGLRVGCSGLAGLVHWF